VSSRVTPYAPELAAPFRAGSYAWGIGLCANAWWWRYLAVTRRVRVRAADALGGGPKTQNKGRQRGPFFAGYLLQRGRAGDRSLYEYHHRNHSMDVTVEGRVALRHKR